MTDHNKQDPRYWSCSLYSM